MGKYLIIHEYTCPICGGDKFVQNAEWELAGIACEAAREKVTSALNIDDIEDDNAYYRARELASDAGWEAVRTFWRERGYHLESQWPPEDFPCCDCAGKGIIRREINLSEALKAIEEATE
jgi:hypothetical protein